MWENTQSSVNLLSLHPNCNQAYAYLTLWTYCQDPILGAGIFLLWLWYWMFHFSMSHYLPRTYFSHIISQYGSGAGWLTAPSYLFPFISFLSHNSVCQLLSVYICKIRTSYYQSFERHTIQTSREKICMFHLHGLRRISFDFCSGSLWILHSAVRQDQSFQVYL